MKDLTEKLSDFINNYNDEKPITLALVAKANNCSVDQVRRRVGGLFSAKKEALKSQVKKPSVKKEKYTNNEIDNSILIKIMSRLDKIENKLDSILSEEWIENTGDSPPEDRLCKVVYCNGKVATAISNDIAWDTYEYECEKETDRVEAELLRQCEEKAISVAVKKTELEFPEFKGVSFTRSLFHHLADDWTFDKTKLTDEEKAKEVRHNKARNYYDKALFNEACRLFDLNKDEYIKNNYSDPGKAYFIKKYKIIDDSNSRVMDKLAVLGRKIDSLK